MKGNDSIGSACLGYFDQHSRVFRRIDKSDFELSLPRLAFAVIKA